MTQFTYIEDLLSMESDEPEHSNVAEFYSGCNVLVTDASDFINKLIVEKLLRSCPKIGKLFILVKLKAGVAYKDKLKSIFNDMLFERLHREQPHFKSHVTLIKGDTAESKLGLSSTSWDFLQKNTHVVIHKPATSRCDERLRCAVNINANAVKLMLQLAGGMPNLKAFVYVSSVFSHYPNQYINERFYKSKKSAEKVMSLIKVLDDNLLNFLAPKIIGNWPNANTFSQSLAEEIAQIYGSRLPICIVRSAIALSTYKEPLCGYIDESHKITKSLASTALGAIHVLHIDGQCTAEVVPADYIVNNVLAAAWDVHETWSASKCTWVNEEMELPIYNCVSSCQKIINWDTFMRLNQDFMGNEPSIMTFWYHYLVLVNYKWLYKLYTIFLHILPATIIDVFIQPTYPNFKLLSAYQKIHKVNNTFAYYGSKQWVFSNSNVLKLWNKMSLVDRNKFDFNIGEIDWEEYMRYFTRALRIYLLKDQMSSLGQARTKYNKIKIAHYALMASLCFTLYYIIKLLLQTYTFI